MLQLDWAIDASIPADICLIGHRDASAEDRTSSHRCVVAESAHVADHGVIFDASFVEQSGRTYNDGVVRHDGMAANKRLASCVCGYRDEASAVRMVTIGLPV